MTKWWRNQFINRVRKLAFEDRLKDAVNYAMQSDKDTLDGPMKVAMQFLDEYKTVVLQVEKAYEIPYIRRWLILNMGEPSVAHTHMFRYPLGLTVKFVSLSGGGKLTDGFKREILFYIPTHPDQTLWLDDISSYEYYMPFPMWREAGLCLADLKALLLRENYHDLLIFDILTSNGLLDQNNDDAGEWI